ncbi:MAG: DUF202 domain-containing protein [Candidatus Aenigmarchaeota archaeon]|nr:DUF202 domain-containing protein [Candidatus Aenigmarchaeota archaeon]
MPKQRRKRIASLERIREVLAEEQTVLSRERTTHSYMQTGIAFIGVGLIIVNVFSSTGYGLLGGLLIFVGLVEITESMRRLMNQKRVMKQVKFKEKKCGAFK